MSYTPFNAPLLSGLLGDMEVASHFSVNADITAMLDFEKALAKAQASTGVIPADSAEKIAQTCSTFEPDVKALCEATKRDGLVVPELIRQLREEIGEPHKAHLHFGSTSQDVIDTSLILRLAKVTEIFGQRLEAVTNRLDTLDKQFGTKEIMARTRMQAALPVRVSDRIRNWSLPLKDNQTCLERVKKDLLKIQLAGPVGTLTKLENKAQETRDQLATLLGLNSTNRSWHTDRSSLSEFCHWMTLVTATLGKIGQDVALMAQQGIEEISVEGGGGSSAMPHKQNPIRAEALITLARFAAVQAGGFSQSLIHEQERSGTNWTLEWMLLPQICVATGASLANADALLKSITKMGT